MFHILHEIRYYIHVMVRISWGRLRAALVGGCSGRLHRNST